MFPATKNIDISLSLAEFEKIDVAPVTVLFHCVTDWVVEGLVLRGNLSLKNLLKYTPIIWNLLFLTFRCIFLLYISERGWGKLNFGLYTIIM